MKNFLDALTNESSAPVAATPIEVDAEVSDVEEPSAELAVIEVASDQLEEDTLVLESLINSFKSTIADSRTLSRDGFIYASNHVQTIANRYKVEFFPNVTTESGTLTTDEVKLVLESAEQTKEGLWSRFVGMVKTFFASVFNFIKRLFGVNKTKVEEAKTAIVAIEHKMKEDHKEEVEVKVAEADVVVFSKMDAKHDVILLEHVAQTYDHNIDKVIQFLAAKEKAVEKVEQTIIRLGHDKPHAEESESAKTVDVEAEVKEELAMTYKVGALNIELAKVTVNVTDDGKPTVGAAAAALKQAVKDAVKDTTIKVTKKTLSALKDYYSKSVTKMDVLNYKLNQSRKRMEKLIVEKGNQGGESTRAAIRKVYTHLEVNVYQKVMNDIAFVNDRFCRVIKAAQHEWSATPS